MSNKQSTNIIKVVFSNFTLLLAGVITSFVLPKILSINEYGLYKIFNLYVTYIVVLQFGLVEGVYIKYGGVKLTDVSKEEFSGYLKTLTAFQLIISAVMSIVGFVFFSGEYRFICLALSIDIVIVNLTNLYQYLSQSVQRFTELSIRNIIKSVLTVIAVLFLWILGKRINAPYRFYIVLLIAINTILLIWYMFTYRQISFSKSKINIQDIFFLMKVGFPLCLANIITTLIFSLDRQVVSMWFSNSEYAMYAFAYSLLTLISTIVTSVSVVLFSSFKQQTQTSLILSYNRYVGMVSLFVSFAAVVYYPLTLIINAFLPMYNSSLVILRLIIPGLIISSSISIIMHNYYKVFNENASFFVISLITLGISLGANIIAYKTVGTMASISIASVLVMGIWYIITEGYLKKKYKIKRDYNFIFLVLVVIVFYVSTSIKQLSVSALLYIGLCSLIIICIQRDNMIYFYKSLMEKVRTNK